MKTSVGTLLLVFGLVSAGTAAAAPSPGPATESDLSEVDDGQRQQARDCFKQGVRAHSDGAYLRAIALFEEAYELAPNYRILYNLGVARSDAQDAAGAVDALESYVALARDDIDEQRRQAVNDEIFRLVALTAELSLRSNDPDATFAIDGELASTGDTSSSLRLNPGSVEVVAKASDGRMARRIVELEAGAFESLSFTFEVETTAPPAPAGLSPTALAPRAAKPEPSDDVRVDPRGDGLAFYEDPAVLVPFGATVALGAATVAAFAVTNGHDATLDQQLSTLDADPSAVERQRDALRTSAMVTDVLGFATAAAGATTLVMLVVRSDDGQPNVGRAPPFEVAATPTGLRVNGVF